MIHDKIENLLTYIPKNKHTAVSEFIKQISIEMAEGIYDIDGKDIYANIMSYETKLQSDCAIEAHDKYIDIQFTLIGEEGISVYPREELKCISKDSARDVYTFEIADCRPQIQICNRAGWFSLIETNEAHRPQESINEKCAVVKKGVIKIKEALYEV